MCVLNVHVGWMEVLTGSLGDDPQMNCPRSPMSPVDVGVLLSLSVPPSEILHDDVVMQGMDIHQAWIR